MTEPTITELINSQPPRIRAYIHALEANVDPSGMVQENTLARDLLAEANAHIAGLNQKLGVATRELASADQRANRLQLDKMALEVEMGDIRLDAARWDKVRKAFDGMKTSTSERFLECLGIEGDAWKPLDELIGVVGES